MRVSSLQRERAARSDESRTGRKATNALVLVGGRRVGSRSRSEAGDALPELIPRVCLSGLYCGDWRWLIAPFLPTPSNSRAAFGASRALPSAQARQFLSLSDCGAPHNSSSPGPFLLPFLDLGAPLISGRRSPPSSSQRSSCRGFSPAAIGRIECTSRAVVTSRAAGLGLSFLLTPRAR